MTQTIDRMEEIGWVKRIADPKGDRRTIYIELTARGEARFRELAAEFSREMERGAQR